MKAVWFESKGPAPEVLTVGELPDPTPATGEVSVRVSISGVNPSDTKMRGGFGGRTVMEFPRMATGQDGAGVIDKVGPGVPESRVGERVWVFEACWQRPFGTSAEYVTVPASKAVRLPDGIDFDTGAGLGVPAMTAHKCLFSDGALHGRTVLVHGGGGGVGHSAVQLASWAGARVLTTVSRAEQEAAAKRGGAHTIINRKTEDVAAVVREVTAGRGVDRIVDVDFGQNLQTNLQALSTGGTIATYFSSPVDGPFPFFPLMFNCVRIEFVLVYTMSWQDHEDAIRDVTACLEAGQYRTEVGARFTLPQLADAHDAQDSGEVVGKVLIDVT